MMKYPFAIIKYPFSLMKYPFSLIKYPYTSYNTLKVTEYPFSIIKYPYTIGNTIENHVLQGPVGPRGIIKNTDIRTQNQTFNHKIPLINSYKKA